MVPAGQRGLFCDAKQGGREPTANRVVKNEVREAGRDASYPSQ